MAGPGLQPTVQTGRVQLDVHLKFLRQRVTRFDHAVSYAFVSKQLPKLLFNRLDPIGSGVAAVDCDLCMGIHQPVQIEA